jgi:hypothetical protein
VQGTAAPDSLGPAMMLEFDRMTPVSGPYVGPANPVRGVHGGGLPWVLSAATGSLDSDGHLILKVRGLVLANHPAVPPALRGTNPFPAFRAVVSCHSVGAGDTAAITNISTGDFKASTSGDLVIDARVSLPQPCIAPVVFVTGPSGVEVWFAVTGGHAGDPIRLRPPGPAEEVRHARRESRLVMAGSEGAAG